MSNLHTILEELVFVKLEANDDLGNKLCNDFISQAEQKIKELMPTKDDLAIEILVAIRGCGPETAKILWTGKHYKMEHKEIADRVSNAIHSAMMKKLGGE